ncbi:HD domain-containing protein [Uliginosibacterium flavum]|uniref:HD domain-containing protein n=1 Tax=Uliginosibacterium flavum TaxID=1396831 RepID=A0ABV2TFE7_9RHOO
MSNARLEQQMAFIIEMEKLKIVYRQNGVLGGARHENTAEHSWHVTLMALLLQEHALDQNLDIVKVIKMLMVHDIVEIDAGDTWAYDAAGYQDKAAKEDAAAQRIFGLLPSDQCEALITVWREFEVGETPEARFAASLDSMSPVVNFYATDGVEGDTGRLKTSQVYAKKRFIGETAPALWHYTQDVIRKSGEKGLYLEDIEA